MKLSVVIPVYNLAPYLRKSLDSILAAVDSLAAVKMTDGEHLTVEIICVDDGSTDASWRVLKDYAHEHSNVYVSFQILSQNNSGVGAARNKALDAASGEWVMMLDGDDSWSPDLLVQLFDRIAKHPDCDAVAYGMVCVDECGRKLSSFGGVANPAVVTGDDVLRDGRGPYSKFIWSSCDKIYRRSVLERIGLRYETGLRLCEDSLFAQIFLAYAGKVVLAPEVEGYRYLMRSGSAIHQKMHKLPDDPFRLSRALYSHWRKLKTPGLKVRLLNEMSAAPFLGKGGPYDESVRERAIDFLLESVDFTRMIVMFLLFHGRGKSRLFAIVYLISPSFIKRRLLSSL